MSDKRKRGYFLCFCSGLLGLDKGKQQYGNDDQGEPDIVDPFQTDLQPENGNDGGRQRLCGGVEAALRRSDILYAVEKEQVGGHGAEDNNEYHRQNPAYVPVGSIFPGGVDEVHHEAADEHGPANQEHGIIFCQKAGGIDRIKGESHCGKQTPEQGLRRKAQVFHIPVGRQQDGADEAAQNGDTFHGGGQLFLPECQIDHDHHRGSVLQDSSSRRVAIGDGGKVAVLHEKHPAQSKDDDAPAVFFIRPNLQNAAPPDLYESQKEDPCKEGAGRDQPLCGNARMAEKILPNSTGNAPEAGTQNTKDRAPNNFIFHSVTSL